jgi:hypothetical protein
VPCETRLFGRLARFRGVLHAFRKKLYTSLEDLRRIWQLGRIRYVRMDSNVRFSKHL